MKTRIALVLLPLALMSCGDKNERFLIAPAQTISETRVAVSSIEVRDVSLPAYAAASEIVAEDASGALRALPKSLWADDPPRAVTGALARSLDLKSTATVAAEPWPLNDGPAVRVEVRIDQMVARADGSFGMTGQFAITSFSGAQRDRLQRFSISVPLANTSAAAVAQATGQAIDALADEILAQLAR